MPLIAAKSVVLRGPITTASPQESGRGMSGTTAPTCALSSQRSKNILSLHATEAPFAILVKAMSAAKPLLVGRVRRQMIWDIQRCSGAEALVHLG
jgi:hypothetical protein